MRYPEYGYLQAALGRAYTDIDFAAYDKQSKQIRDLMTALGYTENREVFIASEGERAIYDKTNSDLRDRIGDRVKWYKDVDEV